MLWRVIGAGLGVAVAALSVRANAADCDGDGSYRWGGDNKQSIRILSKKDEVRNAWNIDKREYVVDGQIKDENDTGLVLSVKLEKTWQKTLNYVNSDKGTAENKIIVYYYTTGDIKNTCTFTIQTKKESQDYYARAKKVECTDKDAVVNCKRQYKNGASDQRFDFSITLGKPTGGQEDKGRERQHKGG